MTDPFCQLLDLNLLRLSLRPNGVDEHTDDTRSGWHVSVGFLTGRWLDRIFCTASVLLHELFTTI